VALSAGGEHTCGIESVTQAIWCWGDNEFGQLGDGSVIDRRAPVQVVGAQRFSVVSAGARHTCGIDVQGGAYCWGGNSDGQVGDKSTTDRPAPTAVQNP
jgi:alpha-tubulin suppressor-like RCC1 family protein